MVITKAITAQNQWSAVFELLGDAHARTKPARALIAATRDDSTVTVQRLAADQSTVVAQLDLDSTMVALEVPVTGYYRVGVATGSYGGTALTITVEQ